MQMKLQSIILGSGLLNPDNVAFRTVKVRRDLTWAKFNSKISEYFGIPESESGPTFRIWIFKRKNDSDVWRPEPLEEDDADQKELREVEKLHECIHSDFATYKFRSSK